MKRIITSPSGVVYEAKVCPECLVHGNHKLNDIPCKNSWHIINGMFHGYKNLDELEPIMLPLDDKGVSFND